MELKEKLKKARDEKKLSQQALADAIFVSRSAVAKWEAGLGVPCAESMLNGATVKKDQKASLVSPFPASKNDIPERFNIKDHGDLPPCPYDYTIVYKEGQF